jgi:hypothetical protein
MSELLVGLALVMVLEGILPFASPQKWRELMVMMAAQSDKSLRSIGFTSMTLGLMLLWWMKHH